MMHFKPVNFLICIFAIIFSLQAKASWQPSAEFMNAVISDLIAKHAPDIKENQIQGLVANAVIRKIPTWDADEDVSRKVLDKIPKGFSSYNDPLAFLSSFFSDFNVQTSQCLIVMVGDNYSFFKKRFIDQITSSFALQNLSEQEALASVIAHEFAHCVEKIQIAKSISEQNKERFFYLLPFSAEFGAYPGGVKSVEQTQWVEGFADIFQVFYLSELIGDLDTAAKMIIKIRSVYKDKDPGHYTVNVIDQIQKYVTFADLERQNWLELALKIRSTNYMAYSNDQKIRHQ